MKHLITLICFLWSISLVQASEPTTFHYQGEVAGVMCSACSSHVEAALKTIPGVKSIVILPAKDGGVPRLEITATNTQITREACVKALGEQAKGYDVRSLKLVSAK